MRPAPFVACIGLLFALGAAGTGATPAATHRVIVDTDFALPPQDDGLALALALNSPELEIMGITTVSGNFNVLRANADVLRMLEITRREQIRSTPARSGPLVHVKDDYAATHYGGWWSRRSTEAAARRLREEGARGGDGRGLHGPHRDGESRAD